eukprot:Em0003g1634a
MVKPTYEGSIPWVYKISNYDQALLWWNFQVLFLLPLEDYSLILTKAPDFLITKQGDIIACEFWLDGTGVCMHCGDTADGGDTVDCGDMEADCGDTADCGNTVDTVEKLLIAKTLLTVETLL